MASDARENDQLRAATLQNEQAVFIARQRAEHELVAAKEALHEREAQMRSITDATPALIAYLDPELRYSFVNLQYAVWFKRPQQEIIGLHMRDVLGEEAFRGLEPEVQRTLSGEKVEFEAEVPYRDGGKRYVRATYLPDIGADGSVRGIHVMVIDIGDRKRAEDVLRQTEHRLQMAMQAGQMGAWEWIVKTGQFHWSTTLETIHGLAEGTFGGTFDHFERTVHPEDRARVVSLIRESVTKQTDYRVEYRILKPGGELVWIEGRGKLLFNELGQPEHMAGLCLEITDRKKLAELHARLAAVVEHSEDAIISKTLDSIITTWNRGAERMFGYSATEMIGQSITILIPPACLDEEPEILARVRRGQLVEPYESVRQRKDGSLLNVSLTVSPIKDGEGRIIGASKIARDITQRKQGEAERERLLVNEQIARAKSEESEMRARFLAEASANLASTLDYEATLRNVAQASVPLIADWCAVHMREPGGAIRLIANAHTDPAKREIARQLHQRFPDDPNSRIGLPAVLRSGKAEIYEEISDEILVASCRDSEHLEMLRSLRLKSALIVPLIANGQTLGAVTLIAAESGRRFTVADLPFAEDLAARATAAAENARLYREVRQANAAKDRFLAVLSHELRTPLNPVLMTVSDLEHEESLPVPIREQMTIVRRNVELEARLIDDLLDSTRIANGKLLLERAVVDIRELLGRAIAIVEAEAQAKGITVRVRTCDTPIPVDCDPARIQQVIWNVVKNAVKFTPRDGFIHIACDLFEERAVRVSVQDNGIGIATADLERIFNAFDQGAAAGSTHRFGGLGLGLAISKALVTMHDGTLTARSEGPDRGATFIIEFPLTTKQLPTVGHRLAKRPDRSAARLLVVEDDPATADVMSRLLTKRGYAVTTATTIKSALEAMNRTSVDLLITDLGLPDGSGLELMEKIRASRNLPGIAVSGYGTDSDLARSREAGFSFHLTKPVDIERLDEAIQSIASHFPLPSGS